MTQQPSDTPYVSDDAKITTDSLQFLRTDPGAALLQNVLAKLTTQRELMVADVAAFRKHFPAPIVHAAFALAQLQPKAAGPSGKFTSLPFVWAVPEALEQATDEAVARHKATRYAATTCTHIFDLCAGIGGDALALANVAPVTAIDLSPVRLLCTQWNAQAANTRHPVTTLAGDLRKLLPSLPAANAAFHIDPSRRTAGKRSARYEDLIPGPPVLEQVMHRLPNGGIKLSSAVDFDSLPHGHLELISHRRVVVQAMLWTGSLAAPFPAGSRTASIIRDDAPAWTFTAQPELAIAAPAATLNLPTGILHELDGSLTRATLAAPFATSLALTPLTTDGGYLWGASPIDHPALTPFQILNVIPFSEERVAKALQDAGGEPGPVEVKTRGGLVQVDTDQLQRRWTKAAPVRRTVLIFKNDKDLLAVIAQRLR